jgi:hypothetical protein
LQGAYNYQAMLCVAPVLHAFAKKGVKPIPYPKEPMPLNIELEEKDKELKAEHERMKALIFFQNWARANQKSGK